MSGEACIRPGPPNAAALTRQERIGLAAEASLKKGKGAPQRRGGRELRSSLVRTCEGLPG